MKRRDDLDVLRFLAVTGVVLYHIGLPQAQNGFIGVDIFFVLSGFLIMRSILMDKERGSYSVSKFLERRARRIIPALLFVLAVNVPVILIVFSPEDIKQVLTSYLSILIALPNVYYWAQSGYFDTEAKLQVFLHTWSLGLEIQFYVLIGLTVAILFRYSREYYLMVWLKALSIGSFALCILLAFWKPGVNFYLLPSRIWEFTIGSIIAIYLQRNEASRIGFMIQSRLKVAGVAIVVLSLFFPIRITPWPSVLTLVPIFGSALVLAFEGENRFTRPILHNRLLVYFGRASYGWFLWHWPVIVYTNYISDNQASTQTLASLALFTLFIATIQLRFFEQRFQDANLFRTQKFFKIAFSSTLSIAIIATTGVISNGFDKVWRQVRAFSTEKELLDIYLSRDRESQIIALNSFCKFSIRSTDELNERVVDNCVDEFGPAIIVIGDSHGVVLYDILARSNLPRFVIGLASPGSRPSNGISGQYSDVLKYIENNRNGVSKVFFMQSGSYLLEDRIEEVDSNLLFQKGEAVRFSEDNIQLTVDYLSKLSKMAKVIWIGPYTQSRINISNPTNWHSSKSISHHVVKAFATLDSHLLDASSQNQISYVSSISNFKFQKNRVLSEGCIVWRDQDHFSICGRELLANREIQFLLDLVGKN